MNMPVTSTATPPLPASPYRGLVPYTEEDAPFFFGRDRDQERIAGNLRASKLTLLYGPSGVGKSSVLQAGVAFQLKEQAYQNLLEEGEPEFAVIVFNRWQDDPLRELIAEVRHAVETTLGRPLPDPDPADAEPISLPEVLQSLSEALDGELLIILDQFEEYFLYHEQEEGSGTFAVEFPKAVNRSGLRVSFLISIREDALAKLDRFKGRIEGLFENYLRLDYLNPEAARKAIEEPLAEYNRRLALQELPEAIGFTIEPTLVEEILKQVRTGRVQLGDSGEGVVASKIKTGQREGTHIETPYLQLVMTCLWEEESKAGSRVLRLTALVQLGGAEQIVRTHLDTTMQNLPEKEQATAAYIFRYLVTPSGSKIAHSLSDLADYAKISTPEDRHNLTALLNKLSGGDVRILRPLPVSSGKADEVRYEIFHDVLAKAVLDWQKRYSYEQERKAAKQKLRQQRLRTIMVTIGLVLAIGLTVFAAFQTFRAEEQRNLAQTQQQEAEKQRNLADGQRKLALSRQLAAQSRTLFDSNFETATQLALAGYSISPTYEARDSLNDGLLANPEFIAFLRGHSASVNSVAFSPDGKTLASGSLDKTIILWDVTTHNQLATLKGHSDSVYSVAFSPDGKTLASGSVDNTIILWDVTTHNQLATLKGHSSYVYSVAFSPDGKTLASGSWDKTIILWDVTSHNQLATLKGYSNSVLSVAFSPDGKTLASGSNDNTIILWNAKANTSPEQACQIVNRSLSQDEWKQYVGADEPYQKTCPDSP